jgi:glycerol uptake facilitator-like aquaporin
MNPINWGFDLKELLTALFITIGAFIATLFVYLLCKRLYPKTPSLHPPPINTPSDSLNSQSRETPNNKPDNGWLNDGINHFNNKIHNSNKGEKDD